MRPIPKTLHKKTYGQHKARTMGRSSLPSTSRRFARGELNQIRRGARREVRQLTNDYVGNSQDAYQRYIDNGDCLTSYPVADIRLIMNQRRDYEKLSPVLRWAEAKTKHLPQEERYGVVKRLLPYTLPGRHALSHIKFLDVFADPNQPLRSFPWYNRNRISYEKLADEVREICEAVILTNRQSSFNRFMQVQPIIQSIRPILVTVYDRDTKMTSLIPGEQEDLVEFPILKSLDELDDSFGTIMARVEKPYRNWPAIRPLDRLRSFAQYHLG